ncbi:MAG TPA: M48 family metallopeptidase [Desulfatiglandales bacterium]|nr:M48 family metallopeptidase [Desulfatiglandales bacterium]
MSTKVIKKDQFKERVQDWADRLEARVTSITVRPMKTKWASCSTTGRLTFDAFLLELEEELQDYVIVHELLHSRVPNHGKLWKSLMRAHLGDYETLEDELKEIGKRSSLLSTRVKSLSVSVNMK